MKVQQTPNTRFFQNDKANSKIVIASVLKPINDTRLYQKIAVSIAKNFPDTVIHLLAFQVNLTKEEKSKYPNIYFHSLFNFKRLSLKRAFTNFQFLRQLIRIKPAILIIGTFELLPSAVLYKIFFGGKLIYDVQENYFKNILHTKVFPPILKQLLAFGVRLIERTAHFWINKYFLAEKCYGEEMPFVRKKSILLENKVLKSTLDFLSKEKQTSQHFEKFIYTGTISEDYGIFRAIDFVIQLHQINPNIQLKILGFCPKKNELEKLQTIIQKFPFIKLIGGEKHVLHTQILQEICQADILLLPYQINLSVQNRIPTKLYEALALQKPMLIQKNKFWESYLAEFEFTAALFTDFEDLTNAKVIYAQLQDIQFYENATELEGVYWEEEKLVEEIGKEMGGAIS